MTISKCVVGLLAACLASVMPAIVHAQGTYSATQRYYDGARTAAPAAGKPAAAPTTAGSATPALKPEELEQVVASIALYPDSLLAQVLMASTYPLEVVQADRWAKQNPSLKGSADALNKLTWDPSVKSLIDFPQVLTMMSEKLDWTVKMGDAFIADQKAVMDAVQRLRGKAYTQGNLKTSKEQNVKVEAAPATAAAAGGSSSQVIVIESSNPSVVYVPTYNPTVVYGAWPYPAYPPSYYYPPGYVAGATMVSFGLGVAVGAAWGHAWGHADWDGGDVEVDIDKNVNFNGNIDREKYKAERDARQTERGTRQTDRQGSRDTRQTDRQGQRGQGGRSSFQHDPSHRQGVAYRDSATNERFRGSNTSQNASQAREAYRGRAEAGRQDIARGGADSFRGTGGNFGAGGARTMDTRGGGTAGARDLSGTRSSGFSGTSSSAASARAASNRGQTSRSSSSYGSGGGRSYSSGGSRSSGGYSGGGARSGGGGARGGGGGGGGGGRGGGRR